MTSALHDVSLRRAFSIQCRVLGALLMRETITRYGRHNISVLWMIVEPMMFTLGIAALWYVGKLHTLSDIPVVAFAVTGYSSVLIWRNATNRCSKAIEPNLGLMYHRNVKVIDLFLSRIILELLGGTASLIVLSVMFATLGIMAWPHDLFTVLCGWLLLCWLAIALGLIVGSMSELSELFERMWHVANYLMFPVSGAVYMVDWLPRKMQDAILWLPMVHGVEMVRHGYFGATICTHENPAYFAVVNVVLTLIGLVLARDTGRKVQPE